MDLFDWFFKQIVTEGEMDEAFEQQAELADRNIMADQSLTGIAQGGNAAQHFPGADLTIDLSAPIAAYDQNGARIFIPGAGGVQNVDNSVDSDSVSTAVVGGGNTKIVSTFIQFDRILSDPRTDGNAQVVQFRRGEHFKIIVTQGAESGGTPTPPALMPDALLVCDVTRSFGQTQIVDNDISTIRREKMFVVATVDFAINVGTQSEAFQATLDEFQGHVDGSGAGHEGTGIDFTATDSWHDGSGLSSTDVGAAINEVLADLSTEAGKGGGDLVGLPQTSSAFADALKLSSGSVWDQIDEIVSVLGDNVSIAGAARIGAELTPASLFSGAQLARGDVASQTDQLLSLLGANAGGGEIGHIGGATWQDGVTIATQSLSAAIDQIVSDLAGNASENNYGGDKIGFNGHPGSTWNDGTVVGATRVGAAIDEIVDDLATQTGAGRIGVSGTNLDFPYTGSSIQAVLEGINDGFVQQATAAFGVANWIIPDDAAYEWQPIIKAADGGNDSTVNNWLYLGDSGSYSHVRNASYVNSTDTWQQENAGSGSSFIGWEAETAIGSGTTFHMLYKEAGASPWLTGNWDTGDTAGLQFQVDQGSGGVSKYSQSTHSWNVFWSGATITCGIGGFDHVQVSGNGVGGYGPYGVTLNTQPASVTFSKDAGVVAVQVDNSGSPTMIVRDYRGLCARLPSTATGFAAWVGHANVTA